MSSLSYTFFMMVPVYVNLNILKESILDRYKNEAKKTMRIFVYVPYVVGVLLNALFFAWVLKIYSNYSITFLQSLLPLLLNALIIFGVQLISTGLMFKREFFFQKRTLVRKIRRLARFEHALSNLNLEELEKESTGISSTNEMIYIKNKAGTNQVYFPAKELLYIEAFDNGSIIYYKKNDGVFQVKSSDNLTTIFENGLLPNNLAVRVQKSFIVAKHQVIGRNENNLLLNVVGEIVDRKNKLGVKIKVVKPLEIPIGGAYRDQIALEKWAGLNQKVSNNYEEESV